MDFANLEEFTISSETGRAPLHFFCKHGRHCAVCKIIKEQPSSVGEADSRGRTPLHEAAAAGFETIVAELLRCGGEADRPDGRGLTALHEAAGNGHEPCVALLLRHGASPNRGTRRRGSTPLHGAALGGHHACVAALASAGGDANKLDRYGLTPLTRAAGRGCAKSVAALLAGRRRTAATTAAGARSTRRAATATAAPCAPSSPRAATRTRRSTRTSRPSRTRSAAAIAASCRTSPAARVEGADGIMRTENGDACDYWDKICEAGGLARAREAPPPRVAVRRGQVARARSPTTSSASSSTFAVPEGVLRMATRRAVPAGRAD
ncbi:hypothetical protein SO694_0022805 [Aureococcus anophagefferens]|uniref:Uncharacterized protein n=1 Tax=Aureococcus anophagefferens TaxID=44056 RepID=A0ABR1FPC7_AURAN